MELWFGGGRLNGSISKKPPPKNGLLIFKNLRWFPDNIYVKKICKNVRSGWTGAGGRSLSRGLPVLFV
jgi:hypothetical protein